MGRSEVIDRLWADSELFLSREQFERSLAGWDIEQLQGDNGVAVVVLVNGPEFHFTIWQPGFRVTRDHLRRWPGEIIARHGYAITRTPKEDARQLRFNRRLGFVPVGEDEFDVIQRIDKLRL